MVGSSTAVFVKERAGPEGILYPTSSTLCQGEGVAQLLSFGFVYVLEYYEEVRVGLFIRWLLRLVLFRVLMGLWRIIRRR
jgi:hypothetical protein